MPLSDEVRQRMRAAGIGRRSRDEVVHRMTAKPDPSCFDQVTYTGNVAVDGQAELDALMGAFRARATVDDPPFMPVTDSRHYTVVCFLNRDEKEHFLLATGLYEHGDKYLDGAEVLARFTAVRQNGPIEVKGRLRLTHDDLVQKWLQEKPDLTEQQIAFRLAAEQNKTTMEVIGDSEYWFAVCFRTAAERDAFLTQHPPVPGAPCIDGYTLADQLGVSIPHINSEPQPEPPLPWLL